MVIHATHAILAIYCGLLAWAALSDALSLRIPNRVPLSLLILYPCYLALSADAMIGPVAIGAALAIAAIVFAIGFFCFARGWMGGGDVKLMTVGALWAGPALVPEFLIVTSLIGGIQALFSVLRLRALLSLWFATTFAYAPALAAGSDTAPLRHRRLPYGVAIAAGGVFVAARLAGLIVPPN
ncbi:MAG: prepilin peptidase [Rhodospirillales bacterium]